MLRTSLILLTFATFLSAGVTDVKELDDNNFETGVAEIETTLVMFYAPWCRHYKRLRPKYAKAAQLLKGNDPPIALAKVDCTVVGEKTCDKFSIERIPYLKVFKNGTFSHDYDEDREVVEIVKYMRAQVGTASMNVTSVDDLQIRHVPS